MTGPALELRPAFRLVGRELLAAIDRRRAEDMEHGWQPAHRKRRHPWQSPKPV